MCLIDRGLRRSTAAAMAGRSQFTDTDIIELADLAVAGLTSVDTVHASGRYLRHVARLIAARVIERAWKEASHV